MAGSNWQTFAWFTAITEASGTALESVTYNQAGDRLSKTGSGLDTGTYSYNLSSHQLNAVGSNALTVDAAGNTTAMTQAGGTYGYGFSNRNRMTVLQLGGSTVANYTYNAAGQRVQKVASSTTERYDYDEGSQMLGEYGATNLDYIWMDGVPIANVDASGGTSTVSYVTEDHLNTPRAVADINGNTLWQWGYQGNAWGELSPTSISYTYNFRFPGQYYDQETGFFYNVNRDNDPGTGRYRESDPMGLNAGPNTYAYALNNPLSNVDPLGLAPPAAGAISPAAPGVVPDPFTVPNPLTGLGNLGRLAASTCETLPWACVAVVVAGSCVYSSPTADSCADEPHPLAGQCIDHDADWFDYCKTQFIGDTKWCDNNFTGRDNFACHAWADAELWRCRDHLPSEPFRL